MSFGCPLQELGEPFDIEDEPLDQGGYYQQDTMAPPSDIDDEPLDQGGYYQQDTMAPPSGAPVSPSIPIPTQTIKVPTPRPQPVRSTVDPNYELGYGERQSTTVPVGPTTSTYQPPQPPPAPNRPPVIHGTPGAQVSYVDPLSSMISRAIQNQSHYVPTVKPPRASLPQNTVARARVLEDRARIAQRGSAQPINEREEFYDQALERARGVEETEDIRGTRDIERDKALDEAYEAALKDMDNLSITGSPFRYEETGLPQDQPTFDQILEARKKEYEIKWEQEDIANIALDPFFGAREKARSEEEALTPEEVEFVKKKRAKEIREAAQTDILNLIGKTHASGLKIGDIVSGLERISGKKLLKLPWEKDEEEPQVEYEYKLGYGDIPRIKPRPIGFFDRAMNTVGETFDTLSLKWEETSKEVGKKLDVADEMVDKGSKIFQIIGQVQGASEGSTPEQLAMQSKLVRDIEVLEPHATGMYAEGAYAIVPQMTIGDIIKKITGERPMYDGPQIQDILDPLAMDAAKNYIAVASRKWVMDENQRRAERGEELVNPLDLRDEKSPERVAMDKSVGETVGKLVKDVVETTPSSELAKTRSYISKMERQLKDKQREQYSSEGDLVLEEEIQNLRSRIKSSRERMDKLKQQVSKRGKLWTLGSTMY